MTAVDLFNRADSTTTMGTALTGQAWTVINDVGNTNHATWGINGNRAYIATSSAGHDVVVVNTSLTDNIIITATISVVDVTNSIIFRCIDNNNWNMVQLESGLISIYKLVSGTFTDLGDVAWTAANGDILSVALDGPSMAAKVVSASGATSATNTKSDAANITGKQHGLRGFGTSSTATRFDNFSIVGNPGSPMISKLRPKPFAPGLAR